MHALARDVEEGSLDMDSEHPGHACGDRGANRCDGARDDLQIGADECGKKSGGAEAPVCAADRRNRLYARGIVEQYAAAAIHLRVDESRQQQRPAEIVPSSRAAARIGGGEHVEDSTMLDEHASILHELAPAQHAAIDEGEAHHTVSVTLVRCAGRSGSMPRASARAFTIR